MVFIGKNTDFKVIWDCSDQNYEVFYKEKSMNIKKEKFIDVQSYLN